LSFTGAVAAVFFRSAPRDIAALEAGAAVMRAADSAGRVIADMRVFGSGHHAQWMSPREPDRGFADRFDQSIFSEKRAGRGRVDHDTGAGCLRSGCFASWRRRSRAAGEPHLDAVRAFGAIASSAVHGSVIVVRTDDGSTASTVREDRQGRSMAGRLRTAVRGRRVDTDVAEVRASSGRPGFGIDMDETILEAGSRTRHQPDQRLLRRQDHRPRAHRGQGRSPSGS
jgi:hypothetical protein